MGWNGEGFGGRNRFLVMTGGRGGWKYWILLMRWSYGGWGRGELHEEMGKQVKGHVKCQ